MIAMGAEKQTDSRIVYRFNRWLKLGSFCLLVLLTVLTLIFLMFAQSLSDEFWHFYETLLTWATPGLLGIYIVCSVVFRDDDGNYRRRAREGERIVRKRTNRKTVPYKKIDILFEILVWAFIVGYPLLYGVPVFLFLLLFNQFTYSDLPLVLAILVLVITVAVIFSFAKSHIKELSQDDTASGVCDAPNREETPCL